MTENALREWLPETVRRLREEFNPVCIYLFGSSAEGQFGPDSDLDLLVVIGESVEPFYQRGARAYRVLRGIPVPIDVQVYTEHEFGARTQLPVSFERTVRNKGRLVYAA